MPELPEVEITARRLSTALEDGEVESALATGVATLKTFEPSLDALAGARIEGVRRVGKMLAVDFDSSPADGDDPLTLLIHLMSAGRLQLFDKRASLRDRRSRILRPDRRRARAAAARVRHQAVGVGEAAAARRGGRRRAGGDTRTRRLAGAVRGGARASGSTSRATFTHCSATSGTSPGSAAPGSTRSSGRPGSHPSRRARTSAARRSSDSTTACTSSATPSSTTRRSSTSRSPTRCRCLSRCTAARASHALAAARRSRPSSSPSTR